MTPSDHITDETKMALEKAGDDFAFCRNRFFAVLMFGSYARGEAGPHSDIDICIVLGENRDTGTILYDEIYPHVRMDHYDVVIFEGCNKELQFDIATRHLVVYAGDREKRTKYLQPHLKYQPHQKNPQEILDELRSVVNAI